MHSGVNLGVKVGLCLRSPFWGDPPWDPPLIRRHALLRAAGATGRAVAVPSLFGAQSLVGCPC